MAERTLIAIVREDGSDPGRLIIASPVVGIADRGPRPGVFLNPLDCVVTMRILNQRYLVRLPRDVQGRVVETRIQGGRTAVAYGDPLLVIDPRIGATAGEAAGAGGETAAAGAAGAAGAGTIPIAAPSEGIFYRRASPETAPYVEVGSRITAGAILGLVEVMKCFNPIRYGGPGLPESGEIVRILGEDTTEVRFGQVLFWVRPIG